MALISLSSPFRGNFIRSVFHRNWRLFYEKSERKKMEYCILGFFICRSKMMMTSIQLSIFSKHLFICNSIANQLVIWLGDIFEFNFHFLPSPSLFRCNHWASDRKWGWGCFDGSIFRVLFLDSHSKGMIPSSTEVMLIFLSMFSFGRYSWGCVIWHAKDIIVLFICSGKESSSLFSVDRESKEISLRLSQIPWFITWEKRQFVNVLH